MQIDMLRAPEGKKTPYKLGARTHASNATSRSVSTVGNRETP